MTKWCRYCLDGPDADDEDGEMLKDICACAGGQRYVHRRCLRRWQRMVLVSQPTHPRSTRTTFAITSATCVPPSSTFPPTRHELMASFTGAEIARSSPRGCHRSHPDSTPSSRPRYAHGPPAAPVCGYRHWIGGAYLITGVVPDDGVETPPSEPTPPSTPFVRGSDATARTSRPRSARARAHRRRRGFPEGVAPERMEDALRQLRAPATLVLSSGTTPDCGEDHVSAVNLTRPLRSTTPKTKTPHLALPLETTTTDDDASYPPTGWAVEARRVVRAAMEAACAKYAGARGVEVSHFRGGPCESDALVSCVVPAGASRVDGGDDEGAGLREAIELAHGRAARRHGDAQGDVSGGQTARLRGLQARPELNGEIGLALRFERIGTMALATEKRRRQTRQARQRRADGRRGREVLAFWGDARWSRAQLLGEIARGHWGLCRGSVGR